LQRVGVISYKVLEKQEKDVSEAKTTMFFIRIMMNCTQLGIN